MENKKRTITISANDGKEFSGTDYIGLVKKCDEYEDKLRKEREQKEEIEQRKEAELKNINDCFDEIIKNIKAYEKATGEILAINFDPYNITIRVNKESRYARKSENVYSSIEKDIMDIVNSKPNLFFYLDLKINI